MKKVLSLALFVIALGIAIHVSIFSRVVNAVDGLENRIEERLSHLGETVEIMGTTLEVLHYDKLSDSYMLSDGREVGAQYILNKE